MPCTSSRLTRQDRRDQFLQKLNYRTRSSLIPGLLEKILTLWQKAHPGVWISFEDTTGFSLDAPEFQLQRPHRFHACDFCEHAKNLPGTRCFVNKITANREAHRLGDGQIIDGRCYLGLSEMVMPLRFRGKTLGVFYCGSVLRADTMDAADERFETGTGEFTRGKGADLQQLREELPILSRIEWESSREDLKLLHDLAVTLLEAQALPVEHYRPHRLAILARQDHDTPPLVRRALNEIRVNFSDIRSLTHLADILHCSPDHLSRQFKKSVSLSITDYLHQVRIEHAKNGLRNPDRTVEEIAYSVGYLDKSHFLKHFKALTGKTPSQLRPPRTDPGLHPQTLDKGTSL